MNKDVPATWLDLFLVSCGGRPSHTIKQMEQYLKVTHAQNKKRWMQESIERTNLYFWYYKILKSAWCLHGTFQTTICHVCCCSRVPWAAMVENNVCPALLRTAGRGSTHNSPSLAYRHSHRQSKGGAGWKGRFRISPFSWACFCSTSSSLSNSCVIASPLWKK